MKLPKQSQTLLIVGYCAMILILSVASISGSASLNKKWILGIRSDYLLHALQFVPWMVLIRWRWREKKGAGFFLLALGAGLLLAVISEGVQFILPYRSFNIFDLVANCVGLVLGGMISWKMMRLEVIGEWR